MQLTSEQLNLIDRLIEKQIIEQDTLAQIEATPNSPIQVNLDAVKDDEVAFYFSLDPTVLQSLPEALQEAVAKPILDKINAIKNELINCIKTIQSLAKEIDTQNKKISNWAQFNGYVTKAIESINENLYSAARSKIQSLLKVTSTFESQGTGIRLFSADDKRQKAKTEIRAARAQLEKIVLSMEQVKDFESTSPSESSSLLQESSSPSSGSQEELSRSSFDFLCGLLSELKSKIKTEQDKYSEEVALSELSQVMKEYQQVIAHINLLLEESADIEKQKEALAFLLDMATPTPSTRSDGKYSFEDKDKYATISRKEATLAYERKDYLVTKLDEFFAHLAKNYSSNHNASQSLAHDVLKNNTTFLSELFFDDEAINPLGESFLSKLRELDMKNFSSEVDTILSRIDSFLKNESKRLNGNKELLENLRLLLAGGSLKNGKIAPPLSDLPLDQLYLQKRNFESYNSVIEMIGAQSNFKNLSSIIEQRLQWYQANRHAKRCVYEERKQFEVERMRFSEQVEALKESNKELGEKISRLENDVALKENELTDKSQELDRLQKKLAELTQQNNELTTSNISLSSKVNELNYSVEQAQSEIEALSSQAEELRVDLQDADHEKTKLRAAAKNLQENIDSLKTKNLEEAEQSIELNQQLEMLGSALSAVEENVVSLTSELDSVKKFNTEKENELLDQNEKIKELTKQKSELEQSIEQKNNPLAGLLTQNAGIGQRVEEDPTLKTINDTFTSLVAILNDLPDKNTNALFNTNHKNEAITAANSLKAHLLSEYQLHQSNWGSSSPGKAFSAIKAMSDNYNTPGATADSKIQAIKTCSKSLSKNHSFMYKAGKLIAIVLGALAGATLGLMATAAFMGADLGLSIVAGATAGATVMSGLSVFSWQASKHGSAARWKEEDRLTHHFTKALKQMA